MVFSAPKPGNASIQVAVFPTGPQPPASGFGSAFKPVLFFGGGGNHHRVIKAGHHPNDENMSEEKG